MTTTSISGSQAIKYASLNRDQRLLTIATDEGFALFDMSPTPSFIFARGFEGGLHIAENFDGSNLFLLVGTGKHPEFGRNKLIVWDDAAQCIVGAIILPEDSPIEHVKLFKSTRLDKCAVIVATSQYLYAYPFPTLSDVPLIAREMRVKAMAVAGKEESVIAVITVEGKLSIFRQNKEVIQLDLNDTSSTCVALDSAGLNFAYDLQHGSTIVVTPIASVSKPIELYRGSSNATISDLCFDATSKWIICSSSTKTLHIYDIFGQTKQASFFSKFSSQAYEDYKIEMPCEGQARLAFFSDATLDRQNSSVTLIGVDGQFHFAGFRAGTAFCDSFQLYFM
eukprot:TRINITY_DN585_c0_g1_i1.p1 TRINITY_DN585_c0_g1~~TRINITY_DN585_c0_g1_i1.p1  ORF type:complete len:358 (-),score=150.52 TRINITY_DN585_c0_g1_i1:214-1224(-)